jgi:hypothetical protein
MIYQQGVDAAVARAVAMIEEFRYKGDLTFAMWTRILAKIEEMKAAQPKGDDAGD